MNLATAMVFLVAVLSLQLSRYPYSHLAANLLVSVAMIGGLIGARVIALRILRKTSASPSKHLELVAALVIGSAVALLAKTGVLPASNEELLIGLFLSVAAGLWICDRDGTSSAKVASICVLSALFATSSADDRHRLLIIVLITLAGAFWLVASRYQFTRKTCVYAIVVSALVTGTTLIAHKIIRPTDGNPSYAAWVPTSGGDGDGDGNARRGKGDGPDEIAGQSPDSIGFDRSDNFSESGKDGLYDLWTESYGAPINPGEQQKMVGLRPDSVRMVQAPDRENLKVGRSFEMRREGQRARTSATRPEAAASASLWIKGPLPAYVPLVSFADFDGSAWKVIEHGKPVVPVRRVAQTNWMEILHRPISPSFGGSDSYEIRIGTLGGDILPMPPHVERLKMGRVDRPQFFASTRAGLIRLASRTLPPGASLEVISKRVSPSRLVNVEPALPRNSDPSTLTTVGIDKRVEALAAQWGTGRPRGWRQIEQVVTRLRAHVQHDKDALVTTGSDPVVALLFEQRRGTDYQIASAAVFLLRSLGYSTRLTSGLFVDESTVDPSSGFASASASNTHFWIEVKLADGTWVTVDPTPGYPMLNLPMPLGDRLAALWNDSVQFARAHSITLAAAVVLSVAAFLARRWLCDVVLTAACRVRGYRVPDVLRVLQLRARLAGATRPDSVPIGTWIGAMPSFAHRDDLVRAINRHLYSEASGQDCRLPYGPAILRDCTLKTLTAMKEHNR